MAYALELAFDIPPAWGYGICALVVIPLVSHGVTAISRLQVWTQPLWLAMLVLPWAFVLVKSAPRPPPCGVHPPEGEEKHLGRPGVCFSSGVEP